MQKQTDFEFPSEVQGWITDGRRDLARFAANGLGILLHPAQIEVGQAVIERRASYYMLDWANRAGKTCLLCVLHMHQLVYKLWLKAESRDDWLLTGYRTLHTAPLGKLAAKAHGEVSEIIKGTSRSQRDPDTGKRRAAPLAPMFVATKERDQNGADYMVMKCINGATTDFLSTEGGAARLEGEAWWLLSWDEWPSTEGDPENIRFVLNVRLTNRAADYNAPIVLTGTRTEETEHIAKEWEALCEDPGNTDWWGNHASRDMNPSVNRDALERARRNLPPEDYNRAVLGIAGGVKGRIIPQPLLARAFTTKLPRFSPPVKGDGWGQSGSEYTYIHAWDLAISAADNIGTIWRLPKSYQFSVRDPILGVQLVRVPGSRTLTDAEIIHSIESAFLPYGGRIWVDTTDAHGKAIYRALKEAGYPVEDFTFNERPTRLRASGVRSIMDGVIRKDRAIKAMLDLLGEGLEFQRNAAGDPILDADAVARLDLTKPFGAVRIPEEWTIVRDQLSILRPDDARQRKDAAMTVLMMSDVAFRARRAHTRGTLNRQDFAYFAGS